MQTSNGLVKLKLPFHPALLVSATNEPTFVKAPENYVVSHYVKANYFAVIRISGIHRLTYYNFPKEVRASEYEGLVKQHLKTLGYHPALIACSDHISVEADMSINVVDFYVGDFWVADMEVDESTQKWEFYFNDTISLKGRYEFITETEGYLKQILQEM